MKSLKSSVALAATSVVTSLFAVAAASAAPVGAGNLVVLRVGDGATTIGSTAGAVTLLEYTRAGALVQTLNVSSSGATALTSRASSTTEGILSLSPDGSLITFGGYRANAGATDPSGSGAAGNVDRVIGVVPTATFVADTSHAISGAASTGNFANDSFRSVVAASGSTFYLGGAGGGATGGVKYYDGSSVSALNNGATGNPNVRQVQIVGNQLYVASGAGNPGTGLFKVGDGLPTSGTQTYTGTIPNATGSSQYQNYLFADLTAQDFGGTGLDTVYVTDTGSSAIRKFTFDGANWNAAGAIIGAAYTGLTGNVNGDGSVSLFVTTNTASTGILGSLTDAAAATSTLGGSVATLATVGTNYAFRGIVTTAVPEPASLAAIAGVGAILAGRRRRRA